MPAELQSVDVLSSLATLRKGVLSRMHVMSDRFGPDLV